MAMAIVSRISLAEANADPYWLSRQYATSDSAIDE